jgi:hypothetical protein
MANILTNFNNLRIGRRYHVQNPRQNGWFEGTFVGHMPQGSGIRSGLARFNEIITDREGYDEIEENGNLSLYFPRTHTFQDLFMPELERITERRAKDQAVRDVYEKATGQSAQPGDGPADTIRKAMGIQPPKGAMGGRTRKRRSRKTRRRHK